MKKAVAVKKSPVPVPPEFESSHVPAVRTMRSRRTWILVALLAVLGILLVINRGLFVAAIVNGRPVLSAQLNRTMRDRYGQQTLEGMIGEILIAQEAKRAGISVSDNDISLRQNEILKSLGTEVSLEDFLKFQGMTEEDFAQQLRIQLTVEKILTKDLVISDADINAYIATNAAMLAATEPAAMRDEARKAIISNTVSEKLQEWFMGVRQGAKVLKFL